MAPQVDTAGRSTGDGDSWYARSPERVTADLGVDPVGADRGAGGGVANGERPECAAGGEGQTWVSIVLVTAIPEEFAFRGVLLGSALRLWVHGVRA
jgi:hypothetical protein